MDFEKIVNLAVSCGEKLLLSGAEVSRVEDTVERILKAYDAEDINVFTITSSIVASAQFSGKTYVATRRTKNYKTDFKMIDSINDLSRYICKNKPDTDYIQNELDKINGNKYYGTLRGSLIWALVAGVFTIFFGGNIIDGLISALIGAITKFVVDKVSQKGINAVFVNVIASFIVTFLAYITTHLNLNINSDMVIIGNIMLLIPGIALTNSIRDLISGDIGAGTSRFVEALLVAFAIAGGYMLALVLFGGAI